MTFTKEITIVKRDGSKEALNVKRVKDIIKLACRNIDVDPTELEMEARLQFRDNITTKEIQEILIKTASEMVTKDIKTHPWLKVARNILLYEIIRDAMQLRGYENYGYGDFYALIQDGVKKGYYDNRLLEYTVDEIVEFQNYIKRDRDSLLTYVGLNQLKTRYLVNQIGELPQEMFMLISMFLALPLAKNQRNDYVKRCYDHLSNLEYMMATPSLSARKKNRNLASCNVISVDDNIESILDAYRISGLLSKGGAGIGSYWGRIRGTGAEIQGQKGCANNISSWLRILNDIAVSVDQLGQRKGAISCTLDIWHIDIYDYLNLRREAGDEKMKAHEIFPAVAIPELFLRRVENNEQFTLFDPYYVKKALTVIGEIDGIDVKNKTLADFYGEEFEKIYAYLEKLEIENSKTINALDLAKFLIAAMYETGAVFVCFRDSVNKTNPNKHKGIIECLNLCTEIAQNTGSSFNYSQKLDGEKISLEYETKGVVQCNLASLNLTKITDDETLMKTIKDVVIALNSVIDMQHNSIPETKYHNDKYRAIGLGVGGYHSYLAKNVVMFESEAHLEMADILFEKIAYYTIKASMELAKEYGKAYEYFDGSDWQKGIWFNRPIKQIQEESKAGLDWLSLYENVKKFGMYNGYLLAIAPTASISLVMGVSPGVDPVEGGFYYERNANGNIPIVMPFYEDCPLAYKSRFYIKPEYIIKATSIRQKWIDQAQSMNLFLDRNKVTGKIILEYIKQACYSGVKSMYYMRTKRPDEITCVNCES